MTNVKTSKQLISIALAVAFFATPLFAQRRQTTPRRPPAPAPAPQPAPRPAPTFETLLAANSYRIYAEVRGVGQLIRSPAVTDLLEPIIKLGSPPNEFNTILKWLNAQADALAASRMMVAGWAGRPKLPTVLIAIEFSSAEEAQKFDPKLRGFIPTLLPTPTPTPSPDPNVPGPKPAGAPIPAGPLPSNELPYHIKQTGSLVLLSDKPFDLKDLTPRGTRLLTEDPNFATARNRFSSESLFLYVDVKSIEKEEEEQMKKYEEAEKQRQIEAANRPTPEEKLIDPEDEMANLAAQMPPPSPETLSGELVAVGPPPPGPPDAATNDENPPPSPEAQAMMFSISSLLFGGQSRWPEAVGAALAFEGDSYVLRTLIINSADAKSVAIPFIPQLVSGPALVPESPGVFPADTELFVALSLDYHLAYDGMVKAAAAATEMSRRYSGRRTSTAAPAESPFEAYEKKLGIKIKDDLFPLLGNEIAVALPKTVAPVEDNAAQPPQPGVDSNARKAPARPKVPDPTPVIAIAIKDRDAVRRLIPKIIESFGFKGANLLAQTEKRDDTEIVSYAGAFSYAFVGNFLVVSTDPAATRRTVNSFLERQTLSSDSHFRNSIRWQPRQLLGQVYVAPDLVERYYPLTLSGSSGNDRMREYLSRLNPVLDPVSYSLTNDGLGPLHELHVPKNLLMFLVAGLSKDASESPLQSNEAITKSALRTLVSAEATFQATQGNGSYGSLEELTTAGLIDKSMLSYGYKFDLVVSGNSFAVTAVPLEYGKTGWLSYFIDESGVLRGADHAGSPATVADQPL